MDSRVFWSDESSPFGSVAFQAEDLVGLTLQRHEEWEDDYDDDEYEKEDYDEDEDWDEEDDEDLSWEDDEEDLFEDEEEDDSDDWEG